MSAIRARLPPRGIRPRVLTVGSGIRPAYLDGREVDAPARGVDALDLDDDSIAEPQRHPGLRADQHRLLLVELPPVAAQAAHRQHPLIAVAERDERAGADDPDHLAGPLGLPAALEQLRLEQEAARDVVGGALDRHRVALALGAPVGELLEARGLVRVLAAADRREQRAVADQVRVAADRRCEVAVARRAQAGVALVYGVIASLLERAQHER